MFAMVVALIGGQGGRRPSGFTLYSNDQCHGVAQEKLAIAKERKSKDYYDDDDENYDYGNEWINLRPCK